MNEQNLIHGEATQFRSGEEAARNGQVGGIASGVARRKKKALRELLREELEKDAGGGLTKAEYLVAKATSNHALGRLTFKDLKDLQDLLGESVQNINVSGEGVNIIVRSEEEAEKLRHIADIGA